MHIIWTNKTNLYGYISRSKLHRLPLGAMATKKYRGSSIFNLLSAPIWKFDKVLPNFDNVTACIYCTGEVFWLLEMEFLILHKVCVQWKIMGCMLDLNMVIMKTEIDARQ